MDVLTIRERAKRLRAQEVDAPQEEVRQADEAQGDLTAAERQIRHVDALKRRNGHVPQPYPPEPETQSKQPPVRRRNRKHQIKQKNIQLRLDQIKSLREYVFRSGNINGSQLNDSQICRVALDIFFWAKINPANMESEEQLLEVTKERIKKLAL